MKEDLRPIETFHSGHRFRSRLEARWAVVFEELGLRYEYEPEGFTLPTGRKYLPDFRLFERIYFEIKPLSVLPESEYRLYAEFAQCGHTNLVLVQGPPGVPEKPPQDGEEWYEWERDIANWPYHVSVFVGTFEYTEQQFDYPMTRFWSLADFLAEQGYITTRNEFDGGYRSALELIEADRRYFRDKHKREHPHWRYGITTGLNNHCVFTSKDLAVGPPYMVGADNRLVEALRAGRASRFEHGEDGPRTGR